MPMQKYDSVTTTLGSAVGAGGSFTVNYPTVRSADDYAGGTDHALVSNSIMTLYAKSGQFSIVFGPSNMTVTLAAAFALPSGSVVYLQIDRAESGDEEDFAAPGRQSSMELVRAMFGAVATAVSNGVCASQGLTAGVDALINGSLASNSIATFDVPRNVVAAWTTTSVLTVTGTDEYGNVLVESSASGTSFTGKKAFKTITKVRCSITITGLTVGSGVVLGLPFFLADTADALREVQDGVVPTAGTFVKGDVATPTATTGDVRGTWAPNGTPNATLVFECICAVRSRSYKGRAQFAG